MPYGGNPYQQLKEESEKRSKPVRKPWGWGKDGDQENPLSKLLKKVAKDSRETVMDLRDEPDEAGYRIRERLRSYLGGSR